jgi:dihydrofolate reductase
MAEGKRPRIVQVVAVARNGVIGAGGEIPWRVPSDLKTFRRLTLRKPIIMGRKTFASIGKPLDKRHNIVISRQAGLEIAGATVVDSLDAAVAAAGTDADEIVIIGGGEIYRASRPLTDRVYLTWIDGEPEGDAFFDPLEPEDWEQVSVTDIAADPRDDFPARLEVYDRVSPEERVARAMAAS